MRCLYDETVKQIKSEVCYSENDSVQKELVDQISKFGITKLVLGTSQSVLSRYGQVAIYRVLCYLLFGICCIYKSIE